MSVVIQVGARRPGLMATFEDGRWVRGNVRLVGGLNELLRQEPIPDD